MLGQTEGQTEEQTEGQKDRQTLFYRSIPATTGGPKKYIAVVKKMHTQRLITQTVLFCICFDPNRWTDDRRIFKNSASMTLKVH